MVKENKKSKRSSGLNPRKPIPPPGRIHEDKRRKQKEMWGFRSERIC